MPRVYFTFVLFLSLLNFVQNVNIGGIFPEENEREEAFKIAIQLINNQKLSIIPTIEQEPPINPIQAIQRACSILSVGVIGIFASIVHEENGDVIRSLCDKKEMPLFETRWDYDPPRSTSVINFYPYPATLSEIYVELVKYLGWTTFTILYEDDASLLRVNKLLKMMHLTNVEPILVHRLDFKKSNDAGNDYRQSLKEARKSGQKNFLLDCSLDTLEVVLYQAQQVGLITSEYNFIITNLDFHILETDPYKYSETKIISLRMVDPKTEIFKSIVENLPKESRLGAAFEGKMMLETALLIDAVHMLGKILEDSLEYTATPLGCNSTEYWEHGYSLTNIMKTTTHTGLTGSIKFDEKGFRSDFDLEIIELEEKRGINKIGTWMKSTGLKMFEFSKDFALLSESNMKNKTFIVITCLTDPYGMLKKNETRLYGNDQYEGFGIDLIDELAKLLGFNYTFIIREDKKNGEKDPVTGKWSGMIGDLIDGTADLAITDLTITSDREEAVDFSPPFMNLGISILYRKPTKAPPKFFSFAAPFGLEVWMSIGGAYLIVTITLFVCGRLSPAEWNNPFPCVEEPEFLVNQFSIRNSFWFTIGSIMQQGSEIAPIAMSTRMIGGMWWFFTLIMVSSYTANLAAFLTLQIPNAHFSNVEELVQNAKEHKLKWGAKSGGATANFFIKSTNPLYKQIGEFMEHNPKYMVGDNKEGVAMADNADTHYAFFMESTSIEYEIERKCTLTQVGNPLDDKGYGIAMRKESPYRKDLSTAMLRLQSSGKIRDLKRKWWQELHGGGQCSGEDTEGSAVPLNLQNVEGVFYVTLGGVVSALLVTFIEMILHNLKVTMKQKTSFSESVKDELRFYVRFGENTKPVIKRSISKSKSKSKSPKELNKSIDSEQFGKEKLLSFS